MSDQYNPYGDQPQNPYGGQPADPYAQQNPYAQPQADPYAQQNPYAQPQADPYAQQNPYAQKNPYAQSADPYAQGNPYAQNSFPGGAAAPKKKSKAPLIITLCVVLAAAIGVGVYFLFIKKDKEGGSDKAGNTPKDVAEAFVDAFVNYDTNKIASLFPPELAGDSEVQQMKQMFDLYKSMGVVVKFNDTKYDVGEDYDDSDLSQLKSTMESQGYNISDKIKNAKNVTITSTIETTYAGQTEKTNYKATLVVSKIDGEWKILGAFQ